MDIKDYIKEQTNIRILANRLTPLCGKNLISKLDDEYLSKLLKVRLNVLNLIDDIENPEEKIEFVLACLLSICAAAKVDYSLDII